MTECLVCGRPSVVSKEQALKLDCTGIHFLEEGGHLVAIQSRALRVGNNSVLKHVDYGLDVSVGNNCDLYRCRIGNHTKVKHFVEIQGDVIIGQFCKIESYCFIPSGTRIGDFVFLGPAVKILNDKNPRATGEWKMAPVVIEDHAVVGGGAVLLPGVTLGQGCMVGAGAVVTKGVAPHTTVMGNPAKPVMKDI